MVVAAVVEVVLVAVVAVVAVVASVALGERRGGAGWSGRRR